MRVLIVEDDQTLGASLKDALEKHSYGVDWVQDGETAHDLLMDTKFSIVILDVNLPRMNGLDVLREARKRKDKTPVMLLTARDTSRQKVEGLDSGADDYIIKPFELDELLARLRALIRRSEGRNETILKCGDVELDPVGSIVRKAGVPIVITAKEFRLLKFLMERADKYCTKSDIEYSLYDIENMAESNATEVTIYSLRKKLGGEFIKSIRGVGYMVSQ